MMLHGNYITQIENIYVMTSLTPPCLLIFEVLKSVWPVNWIELREALQKHFSTSGRGELQKFNFLKDLFKIILSPFRHTFLVTLG